MLGWKSSRAHRLPRGSRPRGVPPQSTPQQASVQPLCPRREGMGQGPRAGMAAGPSWHPWGGGLCSPGAACGRAPMGCPWAFPSLELSAGPVSIQHPGTWLLRSSWLFEAKKCPFSSFFLPAVTAAKYFILEEAVSCPPPIASPPELYEQRQLCQAGSAKPDTPAATSRLGLSPAPGVPSPPLRQREVAEVGARSTGL